MGHNLVHSRLHLVYRIVVTVGEHPFRDLCAETFLFLAAIRCGRMAHATPRAISTGAAPGRTFAFAFTFSHQTKVAHFPCELRSIAPVDADRAIVLMLEQQ